MIFNAPNFNTISPDLLRCLSTVKLIHTHCNLIINYEWPGSMFNLNSVSNSIFILDKKNRPHTEVGRRLKLSLMSNMKYGPLKLKLGHGFRWEAVIPPPQKSIWWPLNWSLFYIFGEVQRLGQPTPKIKNQKQNKKALKSETNDIIIGCWH